MTSGRVPKKSLDERSIFFKRSGCHVSIVSRLL